jgi:hypothetical protein
VKWLGDEKEIEWDCKWDRRSAQKLAEKWGLRQDSLLGGRMVVKWEPLSVEKSVKLKGMWKGNMSGELTVRLLGRVKEQQLGQSMGSWWESEKGVCSGKLLGN